MQDKKIEEKVTQSKKISDAICLKYSGKIELKPCPFCGGEADIWATGKWVSVSCKKCSVTVACDSPGAKNILYAIVNGMNKWNERV